MDDKRMVVKSVPLGAETVSDEDLAKINSYALKELKADDVFVFKAIAADNHTDDRNFEPFSLKAIEDMVNKYPGKPLIFDHSAYDSQKALVGRVFDAYAEPTGEVSDDGELVKQLILKMYILKIPKNDDLIKEIEAGIRSSVSTCAKPEKFVCSICGADNTKTYCSHWPGREYNGKTCKFKIDGVKDVYEISFVYQGAQPRARTIKAFNPNLPDLKIPAEERKTDPDLEKAMLDATIFAAEAAKGDDDDE